MSDTPTETAVPPADSTPTAPTPAPANDTDPDADSTDVPSAEQHDPADDSDQDGGEGADELTRWKRRARDWERRAKRNSELATRYPDLEARAKALQDQYEDALGARTRAEAELWRERAARAHGITEDLFEFLTGSSEAEVMERAERIAAKVTGPRRPLPDPTQGRSTSAPPSPEDALNQYLRDRLNR
ncbi:hypothetical protein ACFY12_35020 [Streptomyces sp. NPDC001339]|uniref:hypothetical protein n=1 Tax=Streptomyces sp. NPDC001339 TaxID=3364563 RepID=UPI0036B50230